MVRDKVIGFIVKTDWQLGAYKLPGMPKNTGSDIMFSGESVVPTAIL